jgi:group I intron endonuclease
VYGYIYKTTNLINNRSYIGQKKSDSFCPTYYGSGILLETALQKYGKDNFQIEILYWAKSKEELDLFEIEYIKKYSQIEKLYNITEGGTGGDTTTNHPNRNEIVKKRADGVKQWHESLTDDQRLLRNKKIQSAKKGKSNGHKGFKQSPETIEKIRKSNIEFDRGNDPNWKKAHADAMAKRAGKPLVKKYKSVIIDDVEYPSIKHAMEALGIKHRATFYNRINQGILKVVYK